MLRRPANLLGSNQQDLDATMRDLNLQENGHNQQQQQQRQELLRDQPPPDIEMVSRCSLLHYWDFTPVLLFTQVEAAFDTHRVRAVHGCYNLLIGNLPTKVAQEVSDIMLAPPGQNRYEVLKRAVL